MGVRVHVCTGMHACVQLEARRGYWICQRRHHRFWNGQFVTWVLKSELQASSLSKQALLTAEPSFQY